MYFPSKINKDKKIGVTAPSDGNRKETDIARLNHGIEQFKKRGYTVLETKNVRTSENGRSSDAKTRAKEFMELIENHDVDWIVIARGGDFLCEMLPYVAFDKIKQHPKWIQGYSDPTSLAFTITTNLDIATVYSSNMSDFGMEVWHEALENNLKLLEGENVLQRSFDLCEATFSNRVTGLEGYDLVQKVNWVNARQEDKIEMSGRLLGGCLDVLLNLVGTKYDKTKEFVEKYKEDKILWYMESFDLNSECLLRGLWQLKEAGWFEHTAGFMFGRPMLYTSYDNIPYQEVVLRVLEEFNVPIILDADIGHKAPQFTMINGAKAKVTSSHGAGKLEYVEELFASQEIIH